MKILNITLSFLFLIGITGLFFYIISKLKKIVKTWNETEKFDYGNLFPKYDYSVLLSVLIIIFFLTLPIVKQLVDFYFFILEHFFPGSSPQKLFFLEFTIFFLIMFVTFLFSYLLSLNIVAIIFSKIFSITRKQAIIIFKLHKYPKDWINENHRFNWKYFIIRLITIVVLLYIYNKFTNIIPLNF